MKKQQKLPYNRSTPPFLEFQTVRQCLRISLPEERMQELMGLRDMQDINIKRNQMMFGQFLDYRNKQEAANQSKNNTKNKYKNKSKNKQKQAHPNKYGQDERLNSQFTDRRHKPKSFVKNKQTIELVKPKVKTVQKSIFDNIKYPENKVKSKQFLNLNNFSQCLYPKAQNFQQIYKIHSQRIKNNRSNNLQQHRQKIRTHRRGQSQLYQQIVNKQIKSMVVNKSTKLDTQGKRELIEKSMRLHNNLMKQICNNSLDSISEYRMRTNFTDEEGIVVNLRNKDDGEQVRSSSEEKEEGSIDSEDEYLLTMVSQDLRTIKNSVNLISNTKNEEFNQFLTLPRTVHKLEVQNIKSEQIHIIHSQQEQPPQKVNVLSNKIDSILKQIQYLKTIEQKQGTNAYRIEGERGEQKSQSKQSSQLSYGDGAKQALDWNNSQPSLLELEIILHNCLALDQNQLQTGRVKHIPKNDQSPIPGIKIKKQGKEYNKSGQVRPLNTDDKWKQSKIQRIKKAQRLLKQGYLQANKILASSLEENKHNIQLDTKIKKYAQKRLKSSLSMSHLQKSNPKSRHNLLEHNTKQMKTIELSNELNPMPIMNNQSEEQMSNRASIIDEIQAQDKKTLMQPLLKLKENGEQVEQIIEIIIIDLCIEMIEDVQIGFIFPTEMFEKVFKMMIKNKGKKKIGFNTGALQVFLFLQKFSKFLQTNKNNKGQSYKTIIQDRIKQPIGPKPLELLKFMREPPEKNDEDSSSQSAYEDKQTFALSLSWFHDFSQQYINQYNFGTYYSSDQERQIKRKLFLKNAMHVHNKAIFDSINETIDKYRPYGVLGEPFPWKKYNKPAPMSALKFNKILNDTFEQVSLYCRFLCGIFIDQHINYKLNQFEFLQFKEDRLNKLLCHHINENQIRWTFIEDEETEMLVEIGRFVLAFLVKEFVEEIKNIADFHNGEKALPLKILV